MCKKLPYKESKFDNDISKYTIDYILNLDPFGDYCYIFVVDIHYPSKLHDRNFRFPLLSDNCLPPGENTKKLMSAFYDKENYNISLLMLKYCLEKGTILQKIHHVIYAKQSEFMKPYINFNNEKRTECTKNKDKFVADQCKSTNNSNFTKKKYKDVKIANTSDKAKKLHLE